MSFNKVQCHLGINNNNLFIGKNVRKPNRTINILEIITMFELIT